jgi:integrase
VGDEQSDSDPNLLAANVSVTDLRAKFLYHHEHTLRSSLATVSRYGAATQHLENFARIQAQSAEQISALSFTDYLRGIEVSPNGHSKTFRRRLRDKGVRYILECCRSMYHFGVRHQVLSAAYPNPFSKSGLGKLKVRDAKPIFVFTAAQELRFLEAASDWAFGIHFVLAKTAMRCGEVVHLLIEDLDFATGWLNVAGKPELGWNTKTSSERRIPLVSQVAVVLRRAIGERAKGLVFRRQRFAHEEPILGGQDRSLLTWTLQDRLKVARREVGRELTRREEHRVCHGIWRDAGIVSVDDIRISFIRAARLAGFHATCPKSWRHTFATLMQEANVDLLVRQETMGHRPASAEASILGMTGVYTHTRPEFQRAEIERALRLRPQSLSLAVDRCKPTAPPTSDTG